MTTMVPVKGVKRYRDRHGKWRCYHRKTGKPIVAAFGTAEFFQELAGLEAVVAARGPVPGTFGSLMLEYRSSPAFADLAPSTKAGYLRYFDVAKPLHDLPLVEIDAPFLATIRDKIAMKRGRRTANYVLAVISLLYTFAKERGYAKDNPVLGVKRLKRDKSRPKANRPWSLEERQTVLDAALGKSRSRSHSPCSPASAKPTP